MANFFKINPFFELKICADCNQPDSAADLIHKYIKKLLKKH